MTSIAVTEDLRVENGAHILYFYTDKDLYVSNIVSFVISGIRQGQECILVDTIENYTKALEILQTMLPDEQLAGVHYIDNYKFYCMHEPFHFEHVLGNLIEAMQPYVGTPTPVRLWGHVDWDPIQTNPIAAVADYECRCDITISDLGYLTVCAYDGTTVSAAVQTALMRSHPYMMTDLEIVRSSLYKSSTSTPTIFPSLSVLNEMENTVDLYKQKLDFVHVVSHEVRNPLTVIKAYAQILLESRKNSEDDSEKLQAILDNCVIIDHEISHIIVTEEMLSTQALWRRKLIVPLPLIEEVVTTMEAKARTQNVVLRRHVQIAPTDTVVSNAMGFKLVISNILSNAIKYSHEMSTVHFSAEINDTHLLLTVKDNGIGMSEAQVNQLFQKYEKQNDETSGQGIGLFMVKRLVDEFHGMIEVESQLNIGTTVRISLPKVQ